MIISRIVSSLEKGFLTTNIKSLRELANISVLKNERLNIQLAVTQTDSQDEGRIWAKPKIVGELAKYASFRTVECIPVNMPLYKDRCDSNYLSDLPGLFPELLQELHNENHIPIVSGQLKCLWIEFDLFSELPAGDYSTKIVLTAQDSDVILCENTINIKIINAELPPQDIYFTQWFHCDCLSDYYNVPVFSERHWQIIENFMRTAVRNGINTILTPIFTPPLDTLIGGERPTVQLIDIAYENGEYSFGFDKLELWIDLCNRCGVEYFEISHFFTQWGAKHAPKIMATKNFEYTCIFGWETDATGEEYTKFLRDLITAFLSFMRARGDDKRCIYHISDEPRLKDIEQYKASKAVVADLLSEYKIIDALSSFEFYKSGAVDMPVPSNNHIDIFIENKVPDLWTYYCCGQHTDVSNRFIAQPSARNRIIGAQMFKYDIVGFLHWGYNFYYNRYSVDLINPYIETSGEYFVPAGDAFSVYPATDGTAIESLRIAVFYEALQDMRAMRLCERLCGKDTVIKALESVCGEIKFKNSSLTSKQMLAMREKINYLIAENIN